MAQSFVSLYETDRAVVNVKIDSDAL